MEGPSSTPERRQIIVDLSALLQASGEVGERAAALLDSLVALHQAIDAGTRRSGGHLVERLP